MKKQVIGLVTLLIGLFTLVWIQSSPTPPEPQFTATPHQPRATPTITTSPSTIIKVTKKEEIAPSNNTFPEPEPLEVVPRPDGEWQGMLVEKNVRPPCEESARCGLGRACVGGVCVACQQDSQCSQGEVCVLDHCIQQGNVSCRSRRDCGEQELCVLSGYEATPRGNDGMLAQCSGPKTSYPKPKTPLAEEDHRTFPADQLAERARSILASKKAAKGSR